MGAGHPAFEGEEAVALPDYLVQTAVVAVVRVGCDGEQRVGWLVIYVENPEFFWVVGVAAALEVAEVVDPAVLLTKGVENVALDALAYGSDFGYFDDLLVRFDVVVGGAVDGYDGLAHDDHECLGAADVGDA